MLVTVGFLQTGPGPEGTSFTSEVGLLRGLEIKVPDGTRTWDQRDRAGWSQGCSLAPKVLYQSHLHGELPKLVPSNVLTTTPVRSVPYIIATHTTETKVS